MAKRTQYIKTNQLIKVNEIKNNKTKDKNSTITQSFTSMYTVSQ